ncbi:MAG: flagellar motor protein [Methanocella sp.]
MDLATVGGLALASAAMLISAIMEGGSLLALIKPSAAVLVIGGTLGATMICYGLSDFLSLPALIGRAFSPPKHDPEATVKLLVELAELARKEGLLALDKRVKDIPDPLTQKGIRLAVDGSTPELVESMLETEIALLQAKYKTQAKIFAAAGGFAPTMGIIGTVMGLVHVLGNLAEPDKLGEAIATAFIATLYGITTANLFWLPIGNKLKHIAEQEILVKQLTLEGILSIQRGDNPRIVEEKLRVFLEENGPAGKSEGKAA